MKTTDAHREVLPVGLVSICVGCGCDDHHACQPAGCWWLRVDREKGEGVCSQCGGQVEPWDRARAATRVIARRRGT